jgi:GrpB-like predicted nucleotidyltransferase (UPF0157 family)
MTAPRPIIIVPYRPEWAQEFAILAESLRQTLGELALRIDHIGSTSVPNLAAKDVIDIQVTVADFTDDLAAAFARTDLTPRPEITGDHLPPQSTGSDKDWSKRLYSQSEEVRRANIHVRRAHSPNGRYALLFRDYLRAHPMAAESYAQAKVALSQHGPTDWDLYYDVKDPICDIIMAGAEDWAATTGWHIDWY